MSSIPNVVVVLEGDEDVVLLQTGVVVDHGTDWADHVVVDFDGTLVECYLSLDWGSEADDFRDPSGDFITDCSPVVAPLEPMPAPIRYDHILVEDAEYPDLSGLMDALNYVEFYVERLGFGDMYPAYA